MLGLQTSYAIAGGLIVSDEGSFPREACNVREKEEGEEEEEEEEEEKEKENKRKLSAFRIFIEEF